MKLLENKCKNVKTILLARHLEKLADLVDRGAIVKPISSDDTQGLRLKDSGIEQFCD